MNTLSNDAREAAEAYAKSLFSSIGAEAYYSLTIPERHIEKLKRINEWQKMLETKNDQATFNLKKNKTEITKITLEGKLGDEYLTCAEKHFFIEYTCFVKVTDGYEFEIRTSTKKLLKTVEAVHYWCLVYVEDDGWKVIPQSAEMLASEYSSH